MLAQALGKKREEITDFIDMYENTYLEKEKLWKRLGFKGAMREKSDPEIVKAALNITLNSRSIFCIELLTDYLYMARVFDSNPYENRINKPGTVSKTNWSLVVPISLEGLLKHKIGSKIKVMAGAADRGIV